MKKYAAMILTVGNEFCLEETCASLISQGVEYILFCCPRYYWDGTPVPPKKSQEVRAIAQKISCKCRIVSPIPPRSKTGAIQEAMIRNLCLRQLSSAGYSDVLIVDGDEIWRPGTLETLDSYVFGFNSPVSVPSLSIIGLPGYPVVEGQEGLLVYVKSKGTKFVSGRSVDRPVSSCDFVPGVIHFTSTRRTMDETIDKHLKSCHYGDSDYDFDGWIKNVLPTIKPGVKDCHMFKPWQVWKEVRRFTQKEWEEIPPQLHQYLGAPT